MRLRAGDVVEVRTKEEILGTLDSRGRLENLPFMPEMLQYCGRRFRVFKRAHKTCDWVYTVKSRRLRDGVHLETRCDGEFHGGCQSACLIYWKEAWLKRVNRLDESELSLADTGPRRELKDSRQKAGVSNSGNSCTEAAVVSATKAGETESGREELYSCQGTDVPQFTEPLPWWDMRQYLEDYTSGNASLGRIFRGFAYASYTALVQAGIGLGPPLKWLYDRYQSLTGGLPHPRRNGTIPVGQATPTCDLNLQPGELVRVKSFKEILKTLDTEGKNRGLSFDSEMMPYCEGVYPVKARVTRYVDEKTGRLVIMKKAAIMLEGVWCQSRYSECRMLCPRSIYSWWHDIWLERISGGE